MVYPSQNFRRRKTETEGEGTFQKAKEGSGLPYLRKIIEDILERAQAINKWARIREG
jgi:hypothetical protein